MAVDGDRGAPARRDRARGPARPRRGHEYVEGWGMTHGARARVWRPESADEVAAALQAARERGRSVALRGAGRSYGDASTTAAGDVLELTGMDRILDFDADTGVADCEGGVTIRGLWRHSLPRGHWPRVVSGTMFPTLAGAAAMNIHGKNNFAVGTIGDAILDLDVVLPDGRTVRASRDERPDLFHAIIGGFGMLGVITRVRLHTKRVHSGEVDVRGLSAPDLGAMMDLFEEHRSGADYLVGWVDCFARGAALGRGLVHQGRNLGDGEDPRAAETMTIAHQELPGSILGFPKSEVWRALRCFTWDGGMRLLNAVKHRMGRLEQRRGWTRQSHAAFNFLLDYVPNWKFAYGRTPGVGLVQYQVFLPAETARDGLSEVLRRSAAAGHTSYLGVLKRHRPDPFLLTHGLDGWSLALDFKVTPATRESFLRATESWTALVLERGGRFYFAKDAVVGPGATRAMFPDGALEAFRALKRELDPTDLLQTDLSRRVLGPGDGLTGERALQSDGPVRREAS